MTTTPEQGSWNNPGGKGRTWMHTLRLRVLALGLGLALTAFALISLTTIPAWPIVGFAVATAALVVNHMSVRLSQATCHGCGADISGVPGGQYGVACPTCGHLTQKLAFGKPARIPSGMSDTRADSDSTPPTA